jgi:acylglycerol lipase
MRHEEGTFTGIRNARFYYQYWLPDAEPKAVLLIVHGLAEHCGRYGNVVERVVPLGYAVYGIDHFGHGRSDGPRAHVERFEDYTDVLKQYFDMVRGWQPDLPVFLYGHSLGGLISAFYLLDHQDELAGAVLSAPGVKVPDSITPATIAAGKVLSRLLPRFGILGLDANGVSRDPAVVKAYVEDPLVFTGKSTARLGAELLRAMQRVTDEAGRITLPLLIVQGSADFMVDPDGAQMLYDRVSSQDKTLKIYEGFYHEVHNEPECDRVLCDVEGWLEAHVAPVPTPSP